MESTRFLNQRLAEFYGIPGVQGAEFRKVDLTGTNRQGVLTQASVLTMSSYANRTSPVLRGKWVLENILNAPQPPPPPGTPGLDEAAVGVSASQREQLEQHRANAVCASCHSRMDPLGFALENYDAIGQWRDKDGKFPIDASGQLPGRSQIHRSERPCRHPDVGPECVCQSHDRKDADLRAGPRTGGIRPAGGEPDRRRHWPRISIAFPAWYWV